jgi:hypothetical protein
MAGHLIEEGFEGKGKGEWQGGWEMEGTNWGKLRMA